LARQGEAKSCKCRTRVHVRIRHIHHTLLPASEILLFTKLIVILLIFIFPK